MDVRCLVHGQICDASLSNKQLVQQVESARGGSLISLL